MRYQLNIRHQKYSIIYTGRTSWSVWLERVNNWSVALNRPYITDLYYHYHHLYHSSAYIRLYYIIDDKGRATREAAKRKPSKRALPSGIYSLYRGRIQLQFACIVEAYLREWAKRTIFIWSALGKDDAVGSKDNDDELAVNLISWINLAGDEMEGDWSMFEWLCLGGYRCNSQDWEGFRIKAGAIGTAAHRLHRQDLS